MVENTPSYVDVNIFIYWLGNHPKHAQTAQEWIKKIEESPKNTFTTSALTIYEAIIIIAGLTGKNLKDKSLIQNVIGPITKIKNLKIEPLKTQDFTVAAKLMGLHQIDYEDSLHLAVAQRKGAKQIISNDQDFDKTPIKRTI